MVLKDKTVLITGAGNAIGRATTVLFANRSAKLFLVDDSIEKLEEMKSMGNITRECNTYPCDISNPTGVSSLYQEVMKKFGKVDILINNSNFGTWKRFEQNTTDEILQTFNRNSLGPILVTHTFLPGMIKANEGKIINVSSVYVTIPSPGVTVFAASKGALSAFTDSLRMELEATQVEVIGVLTAPLESDFVNYSAQIKSLRMGTETEIAEVILKACSKNKRRMIAGVYGNVLVNINKVLPALSESITRQMSRVAEFNGN